MGNTLMAEKKTGFTMRLPEGLLERARNAIWHAGNRTTLTDILEKALTKWTEQAEREHNGGKPFPQRKGELPYSPKRRKEGGEAGRSKKK